MKVIQATGTYQPEQILKPQPVKVALLGRCSFLLNVTKKTEYNQKKRVRRIQNVNAYTSNSKNIDQEHIKTHI